MDAPMTEKTACFSGQPRGEREGEEGKGQRRVKTRRRREKEEEEEKRTGDNESDA